MATETDLETNDLISKKYTILKDTSQVIADPLVRNLATLGGNIAHGDPANDHPATMLVMNAIVVVCGPNGSKREINIDEYDDSKSEHGTGGFKTKLQAVKIAAKSNTDTVIASGYEQDVLIKILDNVAIGTFFASHE